MTTLPKEKVRLARAIQSQPIPDVISASLQECKNGIFISHSHKDVAIARALASALKTITPTPIFLSAKDINPGDEWEERLHRAIAESNIFIVICSSPLQEKDMSWCYAEAGHFLAKLHPNGRRSDESSRNIIIFLYDNELDQPKALSKFQGVSIGTPERLDNASIFETDLFRFFDTIRKNCDKYEEQTDERYTELAELATRNVTKAFYDHSQERIVKEIVTLPRISIEILPSSSPDTNIHVGVNDDTVIVGDNDTLADIFGIQLTKTTWGEIKQRCLEVLNEIPSCISDIEEAIALIMKGRVLQPKENLFPTLGSGKHKFHNPVVCRYKLTDKGKYICYVNFIPSQPKKFDTKQTTSILLINALFAVRFRQRIFTLRRELERSQGDKLIEFLIEKFERELIGIENECREYGLLPDTLHDDYPLLAEEHPLLHHFHDGEDRRFVEEQIDLWQEERSFIAAHFEDIRNMRSAAEKAETVKEFLLKALERWTAANPRFLCCMARELLHVEGQRISQRAD